MKKILVLGASGMAGHMIFNFLKKQEKYQIYPVCHHKKISEDSLLLDVYDINKLQKIIKEINCDCIINCIGILVKGSNNDKKNAIYVNSYFPHLLSYLIHENNEKSKLVHISTDCVFSGAKGNYLDTDIKDATDIYGLSKNLGEINNDKDLTIRTSIIGPELKVNGEGLFHWLFTQRNTGFVNGYLRSVWSGVTTLELAKFIDLIIEKDITGIVQISNNEKISKYDLLKIISDCFGIKIDINGIDGVVSDKSIKQTDFLSSFYHVPSYLEMIRQMYFYMLENRNFYQYYFN